MYTTTNRTNVTVEQSATVCFYYQCQKLTPARIAWLTNIELDDVKTILRRNVTEYRSIERAEKAKERMERYNPRYSYT